MAKPKMVESGIHKGKTYCTQYACLNNYGLQKGIIHEARYPSGCCMIDNPKIADFGNGIWGCSNEIYADDIKIK